MIAGQTPTQGLIARFERRDKISPAERAALHEILDLSVLHRAGELVIHAGARSQECRWLVSGLAARISGFQSGARSFTQLSIAGDFLDLHSLVMKQMDHGVLALTDCITAAMPHGRMIEMIEDQPHLGRLFMLELAVDGAIQREWFHRLGRQDALGRMAHLLCEIEARMALAGLGDGSGFGLAMTQQDFSDCLGMSSIHVNRTLAELRRRNLATWRAGRVEIHDHAGLVALAAFDPAYLRLHHASLAGRGRQSADGDPQATARLDVPLQIVAIELGRSCQQRPVRGMGGSARRGRRGPEGLQDPVRRTEAMPLGVGDLDLDRREFNDKA